MKRGGIDCIIVNHGSFSLEILQKDYSEDVEYGCDKDLTKLEYLANSVFDFTTYDGAIDEEWAAIMLDVIEAILNRKTFEYQNTSSQHYRNYLMMCNMPFLAEKLEWGTSIRGAWFEYSGNYEPIMNDILKFGRS